MSFLQPEKQPDSSKNIFAVISLVLSILFLFSAIFIIFVSEKIHPGILLALIAVSIGLGFIGLKSEKRRLAKVAIVISGIVFIFLSFILLIVIPV
ncbi:hypothetical protein [Thermoflavimicrobium dichotomicum]|uniref:Uncharacterized protein n=1 Tax=Thermoflavimicrobium dichotomicum TaxID=46223 RepID=A0A1I3MDU5_9BACL|nr:hypothetical protein [Thermoflavimicrobium dichotomicum]SFI94895.1 hypothetical protein SAMN05421852_1039 [Thermoflavimicrobium dichotomicum]